MMNWKKESVIDDDMNIDAPYYDESEYLVTYKRCGEGTEEQTEHQCVIYGRTYREAQGKARLILNNSKGKYRFISIKINGRRTYNRGRIKPL